jgi:nitrite reductase/ring-hydroxylating ferredoxin subunit
MTTKIDVDSILSEGAYYKLKDFAERDELMEKVTATFHRGIEAYAGADARRAVERDGLKNLHKHFPFEKIHLLEAFLMKELRDDLYYWSYKVGSETLGLPDPFYVVHLIVFRIHYPHLIARKATKSEEPPVLWSDRLRVALATLRNWDALPGYFAGRKQRQREADAFDPTAYHGKMEVAARSHGPHIDTWYGHSYDGINLWLSIDGVNEDNTVIIYPEMFGRPVAFDPKSMYIARGIELSRPLKVELEPGELLVFNPETLHATQVNISDETRVALTTRINPGTPRFSIKAPFHFEHWYSSTELRRRKFWSMKMFPAARHLGEPSIKERTPYSAGSTVRMQTDAKLNGSAVPVCASSALESGKKLAVDLGNAKLLLFRDGGELRAYSRKCPHLGVDLADGNHDGEQIFCPGHGIGFSWHEGASHCSAFKLKQFKAYEEDGTIYVARQTAEA